MTDLRTNLSAFRPAGPAATVPPLVSCLMVSRGKLFPGRYAIECFLHQTHANRELVVVVDAPGCELIAHIAALDDPRIRLIELPEEHSTLGDLRNVSVASAHGDYVCIWDDDDLYAPERIQVQLDALLAAGAAACVLRRWTLWWPEAGRLATTGVRDWEGSLLALKRAMPDYPALRRHEDAEMMAMLVRRDRVARLDAPDLYIYIRHGSNTFELEHFRNIYNRSSQRWVGAGYRARLADLAATLPIREYQAELPGPARRGGEEPRGDAAAQPLVSIIVRSMGRPELRLALESLAAQDYPALDVIVVDATGGAHPPLPEIAWPPGHSIRMVGGQRRLLRPHAANVGLAAVRGEWFGFLDDDDRCEPEHISELVRASVRHPEALVVHGLTRLLDVDGEVIGLTGRRFDRAVMFHASISYWQAALIRHSAIERGCRVDERFDVCEDRDFLAQVAQLGEFAFVQSVNFNYRPDLGTSGAGQGANRDPIRMTRYRSLFEAKWSGSGAYHTQRSMRLCRHGIRAYARGDAADSESWLRRALREYPDHPNALNLLGYLCLEAGELEEAEALLRRAVDINPTAGEYRINLAAVLERTGRRFAARREAWTATADASTQAMAYQVLARLGASPRRRDPRARPAVPDTAQPSRTGSCPCGSGKRYKSCCGQLAARRDQPVVRPPSAGPAEVDAQRAIATFRSGEAMAAMAMVAGFSAAALTSASTALACGELCREMQRHEEACEFFRQAARLGKPVQAADAVARCCRLWYKPERDASMVRTLRTQLSRFNAPRAGSGVAETDEQLHIVGALGRLGGPARHAIDLHATLAPRVPIRLWSTEPPLPEYAGRCRIDVIDVPKRHFPTGGHLLFIGTDFDYGDWLEQTAPTRITIALNTDLLDTLIGRLVELEEIPSGFALDLTYPSKDFRDAIGLPGVVLHPRVDTDRFRPSRIRSAGPAPLVIGRHSHDDRMKFHPNDPAFYRRLVRGGHQLRIVGGTSLREAFGPAGVDGGITLLPESPGGIVEFLDGLDCFIYRIHPHAYDAGGTVIMEAMSMGLPVVVFAERIGGADVIEHGRNGYLVDDEEQALDCIRTLAGDPELRRAVGAAARASMIALMRQQVQTLLACYGVGGASIPTSSGEVQR